VGDTPPLALCHPAFARRRSAFSYAVFHDRQRQQQRRETMQQKPDGINVYQTFTDRIIASLEKGVIPWERPWKSPKYAGGIFPRNFLTGKPYRGVNVLLLWGSDYSSPSWLTFKQAQELGGSVRKGERSERILFYKQLTEREDNTAANETSDSKKAGIHADLLQRLQCGAVRWAAGSRNRSADPE
jgi:antirestriction protein ArdC